MKKMLCLIILTCIVILSGCSSVKTEKTKDTLQIAQERGRFIVGLSYDTKPFSFLNDKNEPDGFEADIAMHIAASILGDEKNIEFVKTDNYDAISLIAKGKVDFLISSTTITPQRQLTTLFSDPYYTAGQAILVKNNSKISTIRDLNKKNVIVHLNSTSEKTLKRFAPAARLVGFKTFQECVNAFKNNEGEAFVTDDALLIGVVMDNPNYKILPQRLSVEPYGIAMKYTDESKSLQSAINNVLQQMKQDGSLEKLKQKWGV